MGFLIGGLRPDESPVQEMAATMFMMLLRLDAEIARRITCMRP